MTEIDRTLALRLLDERHDELLAQLDELAAQVDVALIAAGLKPQAAVETTLVAPAEPLPAIPARASRKKKSQPAIKVA